MAFTWLVSINVLWLVQISLPLLDDRVTLVFSVPLSELLTLPLGAVLVLCANSLLSCFLPAAEGGDAAVGSRRHLQTNLQDPVMGLSSGASENKPQTRKHGAAGLPGSKLERALFLVLASMWTAGLGMHVSAVVVLNHLTSEDPLYPMVNNHLHRFWSHNIFQGGYFGLLLLVTWSSRVLWKNVHEKKVQWFVFQILWSVLMGVAYTVVADATRTVVLTTCFYVASISLVFFIIYHHKR